MNHLIALHTAAGDDLAAAEHLDDPRSIRSRLHNRRIARAYTLHATIADHLHRAATAAEAHDAAEACEDATELLGELHTALGDIYRLAPAR